MRNFYIENYIYIKNIYCILNLYCKCTREQNICHCVKTLQLKILITQT